MATKSNREIAQQIEQTADYYPPGNYSGSSLATDPTIASYLTYYNHLTVNADPLAEQYIPLSTVPQNSRNPKIFAIGVLPPSVEVTGRILDRSESIRTVMPESPQDITIQTPSGNVEIVNPQASTARSEQVPNKITKMSESQVREAFIEAFRQVTGQNPTDQVLALLMAQSSHETGSWSALHNYNFGNIRPGAGWQHQTTTFGAWEIINGEKVTLPPGPNNTFRAYPNPKEGAADYVLTLLRDNPRRDPPDAWKRALLDGEPESFSSILREPPPYYTGDKVAYARAMRRLYDQYFQQTEVSADTYSGDWKNRGSDASKSAKATQNRLAGTELTYDGVSEQYSSAQRAQILEIQNISKAMQNTPPVRMLVNPSSFSVKGEKIVSDGGWSRNGGVIVEHWGNQQEKISASGKVAGFYTMDARNASGPGLTRAGRNFSLSWQNFQSILLFYSNNGGLHVNDPTTANAQRNLSMLGSIYIYYDSIMYVGSFDSLRVNESDTAPHTVDYSFEFTVRAAFLLDNPNPNAEAIGSGSVASNVG